MGTKDDEPRTGPGRGRSRWWTPINGRRVGGHFSTPKRPEPEPPEQPRLTWVDTGSGPGIEVTREEAERLARWRVPPFSTGTLSGGWGPPMGWGGCLESVNESTERRIIPEYVNPDRPAPTLGPDQRPAVMPDVIPANVQADTLRALLKLHEPHDETECYCGLPLGEETGLCWYGRQAQRALFDLTFDWRAEHPNGPDL